MAETTELQTCLLYYAPPGLLRDAYAHTRLIVLGARRSRHHPMGSNRGELETLLDQVTLDALAFALVRQGRAINLAHCHTGRVPDVSSGYKVYGRQMAEALFVETEPRLQGLSAHDYWHFGPETVPVVEAMLSGGVLGRAPTPDLGWPARHLVRRV